MVLYICSVNEKLLYFLIFNLRDAKSTFRIIIHNMNTGEDYAVYLKINYTNYQHTN